jgi:uncharacterized membrane protein
VITVSDAKLLFGLVRLLITALDYLAGWNSFRARVGVIGLVIAVIGAGTVKKSEKVT